MKFDDIEDDIVFNIINDLITSRTSKSFIKQSDVGFDIHQYIRNSIYWDLKYFGFDYEVISDRTINAKIIIMNQNDEPALRIYINKFNVIKDNSLTNGELINRK